MYSLGYGMEFSAVLKYEESSSYEYNDQGMIFTAKQANSRWGRAERYKD